MKPHTIIGRYVDQSADSATERGEPATFSEMAKANTWKPHPSGITNAGTVAAAPKLAESEPDAESANTFSGMMRAKPTSFIDLMRKLGEKPV